MQKIKQSSWINEIKQHDTTNFEPFFKQYEPIVRMLYQKYSIKGFDWDDWQQEGRIVFYNSVISYKPELKITFGAFFKANFKNRICSILRFEMAYKRKASFQAQTFEDIEGGLESCLNHSQSITPHHHLKIKENLAEYEHLLSSFEKEVSSMLFAGMKPVEISKRLKCEMLQIQNAMMRCKQKLASQLYEL